MCKGFIRIPRRLFETKWWNKKRVYSESDAIIDLYQMANVRDRTEPNGLKLKKAQFLTSIRALADKWLWPTMNASNFLKRLQREGWIDLQTTKSGTIVTILDFGVDGVPSSTQTGTHVGTPESLSTEDLQEVVGTQVGTQVGTSIFNIDNKEDIPPISPKGEKKKSSRFVKPTVADIQAYITEKGYNLNAQQIFDHYEMVGWVYGKGHNPIKDWKAAVRTWNNYGKKTSKSLPIGFNIDNNDTGKYDEVKGW